MKAILGVPNQGRLSHTASFLSLEPKDKLMISAFKQSEDGKGFILRIWNTSAEKINATVKTILPVKSASRVRLDETLIEDLGIDDKKISFDVAPHKIETILLAR